MVVVGTEIKQSFARLASDFPDVEAVDLTADIGDDLKVDVLFGGWGKNAIEMVRRGVQWVQLSGTGFDRVPQEILDAPLVTCARGASAVPISEYVLASMLAFEKDFPANWLTESPSHWNFQRMDSMAGKTLGLVGFGGIGARVARLALAFEMEVIGLRRHVELGSPVPGASVTASLDEILPVADHLVLAAPATARTRHLLDPDAFARMKRGVHIVNIARGTLVDQDALRTALDDGVVARASLDVADPEPLPEGHWLFSHPNVRLTPHSSWSSHAFFESAVDIFCTNLRHFLDGDELIYQIDRNEGY
ncbi:MAG TPA: NAD(P)-dependent oxidoreductase [Acidimicrobiia bacterium]|jgi:phosphoglycerate dehydrogenase-like enzyme